MRKPTSMMSALFSALIVTAALLPLSSVQANTRLGTNVDSVKDWNTQPFFYNAMNHARGWLLKNGSDTEWKSSDRSGKIPQRSSDGYPTQVPFWHNGSNWWVHTLIPAWENGQHKLQVTGSGQIKYKGPGLSTQTKNLNGGTATFFFNLSGVKDLSAFKSGSEERQGPSSIFLEITQSNSGDPIRDIRIMRPGHHGAGKHAFDGTFKNYLSFYDTLRFMDWGRTNDSPLVDWSDRTKKDWYTQTTVRGVAYEHMIGLANQLNKDLWVCVPHKASNSFVDNMASLFDSQTEGARDIFLEYSNEVWNGIFDQANWMSTSGFAGDNQMQKYGTRAAQIFDRWYNQFSNPDSRVVRVIGGQAGNAWQAKQALQNAGDKTDAVAIAPYFGGTLTEAEISNGIPSNDELAQEPWLEMDVVQTALDEHKALADTYGVQLIAYEGGQHYVGLFGAVNNENLTDRLLDFNRSWQMRNIYRWDYLDRLSDSGMLLFCNFASVGDTWGKSGSWTTMEYMGQPINNSEGNAVKEWALRDWKANNANGADVQPGFGGGGGPPPPPPGGDPVIIDNSDSEVTFAGPWWNVTSGSGYEGSNFSTVGNGTSDTATYAPNLATGEYLIEAKWTDSWGNLGTDCPYTVNHVSGSQTIDMDQTQNGGLWVTIGTFNMNGSSTVVIGANLSNSKRPCADAIRFTPSGGGDPPPPPPPGGDPVIIDNSDSEVTFAGPWWNVTSGSGYEGANFSTVVNSTSYTATYAPNLATGEYLIEAKWTDSWGNLGTDCPYTVNHASGSQTIDMDQTQNGGQWVTIGTFNMSGSSTVVIGANLSNSKRPCADAIRFTPTGGGGGGGSANLYIEAENYDNSSGFWPFQEKSDGGASGGKYIEVAAGNNSTGSMPSPGYAEYDFNLASSATVTVHFRVIAPSGQDDSFWVRMNNGTEYKFNAIAGGGSWHWDRVHDNDNGNSPVSWNLGAGNHTLRVAYREDGTKLDRIYISTDGSNP